MVTNCVVNGCHNASDIKKSLSFHGFPFKRPDILQCWITATGRENWYPSKCSKICGEHFLPSDYEPLFYGFTKKRLKIDAVPSIHNIAIQIKTEEIEHEQDVDSNITYFNSPATSTAILNSHPVIDSPPTSSAILNSHLVIDSPPTSSAILNSHPVIDSPPTSTNPKSFVDCACQTADNYRSQTDLKRKLKTLQQKIRRRDIQISHMKAVINEIKKNGYSDEKLEVLKIYFD